MVSGALFEGRSDHRKLVDVLCDGGHLTVASVEDMIADRLGQYEANRADHRTLRQARLLLRLAPQIDRAYLVKRVQDEGGDPGLIGTEHERLGTDPTTDSSR
jgi:hypothetical protein